MFFSLYKSVANPYHVMIGYYWKLIHSETWYETVTSKFKILVMADPETTFRYVLLSTE